MYATSSLRCSVAVFVNDRTFFFVFVFFYSKAILINSFFFFKSVNARVWYEISKYTTYDTIINIACVTVSPGGGGGRYFRSRDRERAA